ncbi:MAG: putative type II secretion system protein E [Elusimicrobia bacterium]|nr:putative type II secretion system protein E [Elusimicrobiota bacterium]
MEKDKNKEATPDIQEPLRPVVAPIPDASPRSKPKMPIALEKIIASATRNRASQILIEKENNRIKIRQRIRGVLIFDLSTTLTPQDSNHIYEYVLNSGEKKSEGGLVWASHTLVYSINSEPYFLRFLLSESKGFSLMTIHLTRQTEKPFNPTAWGMGPNQATLLENFLARSHGLILFCGTETDDLLSSIQSIGKQLMTPERHVIVVEGQSQAWFTDVEQMTSNNDPALFTKILRLAFRHEPDLLVAHPIETKEQMELCLSEAIRGRLVFARLFASDVSDALMQLLSMGVEPHLLGTGLLGVVAQRTLRLNCPRCQDKEAVSRDRLKDIGIPLGMQPAAFFQGKGCDACFRTGFDKETNIFEVIEMTDDLRSRMTKDLRRDALKSLMKTYGLMTLRQMALHKAINGQTSLAEVLRVTS